MEQAREITELLGQRRRGSRVAENEFLRLVFPKLRRSARSLMKKERHAHFVQPKALVEQVCFRGIAGKKRNWRTRAYFLAIAVRVMRRYLIDYARRRPDVEFVAPDGVKDFVPEETAKESLAIRVDQLLDQLADTKPEWCRLVEIKYFLGLTDEEAADALGMKVRTMQRMWRDARQWLFEYPGIR